MLLGCAIAVAGLAAGYRPAVRGLVAAGLPGRGGLLQLVARRRLGGMTGDVFGAIVELSTAAELLLFLVLVR